MLYWGPGSPAPQPLSLGCTSCTVVCAGAALLGRAPACPEDAAVAARAVGLAPLSFAVALHVAAGMRCAVRKQEPR